jgi:hypothetical protein
MTRPDAAFIRSISQVDFAARGYPEPAGTDPDPLQFVVAGANSYVEFITWRLLDASMPTMLEPIAQLAVRMRTEQVVMQGQEDTVETAGDVDLISSFSAGAYSETRKDPERRAEQRALNPWPALNDVLWMLLGLVPGEDNELVDGRRDYWRYILGMAPNPPAWSTVEVDWSQGLSGNSLGYGSMYGIDPNEPWSRYL